MPVLWANNQKYVFSYIRQTEKQKVLVINNLSGKSANTSIDLPTNIATEIGKSKQAKLDLISGKKVCVKIKLGKLNVFLKPYQTLWLEL